MSETDATAGAPGVITIVEPEQNDTSTVKSSAQRKRKRVDTDLSSLEDDEFNDPHRDAPPVMYATQNQVDGIEEDVYEPPKSQVQRLLDAKHRRRRLGKHVANEQIQEDLDDVKKFLSLSEDDREAYLSIYEYDGTTDNIIEGLTKATAMGLRVGLACTVDARDYDLAAMALDMPEVKDSLATIWDCVDVPSYANQKAIKAVSAVGHIGDTLVGAAMRIYQGVSKASELRNRKEQMERRKEQGIQSIFDLSKDGSSKADSVNTKRTESEAIPSEPSVIVDRI